MSFEIRQGDAVELMRAMAPASIDAVVTDPPYGERAAAWDSPRGGGWHEEWLLEADRILKPGGVVIVFASRRYLDVVMGAMRRVLGDEPGRALQTGAWVHRQGFTLGGEGFLRPEHEPFIASGPLRVGEDDVRQQRFYRGNHIKSGPVVRRSRARGFGQTSYTANPAGPMAGTVFECPRTKPSEAVGHPTQKPLAVMEYLVLLAADPDALVLDPFCGSGTTGAAAVKHGRRFIGLDSDPKSVEMARRRIHGPLFADPAEAAVTEGDAR